MLTELDSAKTKINQFQQSDTSTKSLLNGLQESVKERDRTIQQLKEQIKYYVAFAEHSVKNGRQELDESTDLEGGASNEEKEKEEQNVDITLIEELKTCREEIRCLNSHNSELKSQLEVISSQIDHNGDRLSCSSSSTTSTSEDSKDGAADDTIINNNNNNRNDSITNNDAANPTFVTPTNSGMLKPCSYLVCLIVCAFLCR